jgi:tRNA A37 threonylcarbamoyladenosine dehydratase
METNRKIWTVVARMRAEKVEVMKRQMNLLAACYDLSDRVAFLRTL